MPELPPLDDLLACPVDGAPLHREGHEWVSATGRRYSEIEGVPILLRPDCPPPIFDAGDPLYLASLDVDADHRERLAGEVRECKGGIDPVVSQMIAATCGNLYLGLVGKLPRYPIPRFRLENGVGRVLVDVGCNWGRWCIAASRAGFAPIGIDPQLGAVLAAKRVAKQLGVKAHFICANARHLPLRAGVADVVFSYSVFQHFSREDVAKLIDTSHRVMKPDAQLFVQMANVMGPRCFYQWVRRGFNDGEGFNVRYWTLRQLRAAFEKIGPVDFEIDCFFGIGLQSSDVDLMPPKWKMLIHASECLRKFSGLVGLADSVYVSALKKA